MIILVISKSKAAAGCAIPTFGSSEDVFYDDPGLRQSFGRPSRDNRYYRDRGSPYSGIGCEAPGALLMANFDQPAGKILTGAVIIPFF